MLGLRGEVGGFQQWKSGFSVERMSSYKTDDKSLYQFTSAGEAESGVGSGVEIVA